MLVRSWMAPDPPVVTLTTNVGQAYEMLLARRVRVLPLADESGRLMGVVDERDLLDGASHPAWTLERSLSPRARSRTVPALSEDDTIEDAVRIFRTNDRVTALPVLDHEHVTGILTRRAAMRALAASHGFSPTAHTRASHHRTPSEGEPMGSPRTYPPPPPCVYQG